MWGLTPPPDGRCGSKEKTGHLRYEHVDLVTHSHFRMQAQSNINPVKGGATQVHHLEALHVVSREMGSFKRRH